MSDVCSSDLSRSKFPFSRWLSSCHHHFTEHAHIHMKHQVAVPGPASQRIGGYEETDALRGLNGNRVAARLEGTIGRFQFAPHALHVHRMGHPGVVMQDDSHAFTVAQMHGSGFAKLDTIKEQAVAFHISVKLQLDIALPTPC